MKKTILALCILNSFNILTMDAPKAIARSSSSGRMSTLLARHQGHQRRSSSGVNIFNPPHLKIEGIEDLSSCNALVTDRRAPTQNLPLEPRKSDENPCSSPVRNLIGKAGAVNRQHFARITQLAHQAVKNIKEVGDPSYLEYVSHIKYAEYYYRSWISLEITKDPSTLETMADEEFKPLRDAFNKKVASITIQIK